MFVFLRFALYQRISSPLDVKSLPTATPFSRPISTPLKLSA
jgi:hypothetical protein